MQYDKIPLNRDPYPPASPEALLRVEIQYIRFLSPHARPPSVPVTVRLVFRGDARKPFRGLFEPAFVVELP